MNYEEVLKDMGIDIAPISRVDVRRTNISTASTQELVNRSKYETIDIKVLKRGVIGINKIGYVY